MQRWPAWQQQLRTVDVDVLAADSADAHGAHGNGGGLGREYCGPGSWGRCTRRGRRHRRSKMLLIFKSNDFRSMCLDDSCSAKQSPRTTIIHLFGCSIDSFKQPRNIERATSRREGGSPRLSCHSCAAMQFSSSVVTFSSAGRYHRSQSNQFTTGTRIAFIILNNTGQYIPLHFYLYNTQCVSKLTPRGKSHHKQKLHQTISCN